MLTKKEIERVAGFLSEDAFSENKKEVHKGIDFEIDHYGWNRSLESYSDRELRDELKRRKNLKPRNGFRK